MTYSTPVSQQLFTDAQKVIPGGVNSPVRAFKGVGGTPIFFKQGKGAWLTDVDDKRYLDYVGSWGPMILGHSNPTVLNAVKAIIDNGLSFGAPTQIETSLASMLCERLPSMDLVRMVNSGTEATMSAIRLARGYTNRDKIVKFEGCYHGHSDSLLVKAGSGALTLGVPNSPGVPANLAEHTLTLTFNDLDQVEQVFAQMGDDIACIIVEPITGNMNCIRPKEGFLQGLQAICQKHGALLIFDEVMTGFRVGHQSAQGLYDIKPDLTTLGKVIGGGMPVAAFGGRKEVMEHLAPLGPVYQAGTLSGNPVAMAAGVAMMEALADPDFYTGLDNYTQALTQGLEQIANKHGIALATEQVGGMFGLFFTDLPKVTCFAEVMTCDTQMFSRFFHAMLAEGIYFAPSAFEAGFVSSTHKEAELQYTLQAADKVFSQLSQN